MHPYIKLSFNASTVTLAVTLFAVLLVIKSEAFKGADEAQQTLMLSIPAVIAGIAWVNAFFASLVIWQKKTTPYASLVAGVYGTGMAVILVGVVWLSPFLS